MDITLPASHLSGHTIAPSSKSALHRALICASLSDTPTKIRAVGTLCEDVLATIDCLRLLGCEILVENSEALGNKKTFCLSVSPIVADKKEAILDCKDSGATLRFLLPVACALYERVTVKGSDSLAKRPIRHLIDTLAANGVVFESQTLPIKTSSILESFEFRIEGNISSQYVSGLMYALFAKRHIGSNAHESLEIVSGISSRSYLDMTCEMFDTFGIKATVEQNRVVLSDGKFVSPRLVKAEGCWSSAGIWFAASLLGNDITVEGLNPRSLQPDKNIASLANKIASASDKISIECDDIIDAIPVLAVFAGCRGNAPVEFVRTERLATKESNRIKQIGLLLAKLGIEYKIGEDTFTVYPANDAHTPKQAVIDCANDHRIVMAASLASCAPRFVKQNTLFILRGADCVAKSYPDFFEDIAAMRVAGA